MMIRQPSPPFQTVQLHRMRKQFRRIDETDYLGDTIPREERDRLYFSLKEYFKVISTGNDAFKKTFK